MDDIRVLIADDDPLALRHLEDILKSWGYEVVVAHNGNEAWELLKGKDSPRLAILDWIMPDIDGVELCRNIRSQVQEPYIYILLLTVYDRETHLIEGLEAGADDYVSKPFRLHELQARLEAGKRILKMQEQLITQRDRLEIMATKDPVTEIWNRRAILDILDKELGRAVREGTSIGLVMLDLDHFKGINDVYGHLVGDTVLYETAQRMTSSVRSYDSIGRYGGDEFLLVLPRCGLEEAANLGERLRRQLEDEPISFGKGALTVTCSLGVSASGPKPGMDTTSLIRLADEALSRAKQKGRNRLEKTSP